MEFIRITEIIFPCFLRISVEKELRTDDDVMEIIKMKILQEGFHIDSIGVIIAKNLSPFP